MPTSLSWLRRCAACLLLFLAAASTASSGAPPPASGPAVRLYALNSGSLSYGDMATFSDTGDYDGRPGEIPVPYFLIRHPKGYLLWDTGLSPDAADLYGPYGIIAKVGDPLPKQLARLGLTPDHIQYLAMSHLHADHAGNANLFKRSTWLLSRREIAWATANPPPPGVAPWLFSYYSQARVQWIGDDDYDVFGDGSVRILRAPGHSAGHAVLMLRLAHAGTVILSGDLAHLRASYKYRRVPTTNDNRAETLASFDRVDRLLANYHARLIIQHAPEDFASLPKFPAYLD